MVGRELWKVGSWFVAEGGNRETRHLTQQLPDVKCQREDGVEHPDLQAKTAFPGPGPVLYPTRSNSWPTHVPTYPPTQPTSYLLCHH